MFVNPETQSLQLLTVVKIDTAIFSGSCTTTVPAAIPTGNNGPWAPYPLLGGCPDTLAGLTGCPYACILLTRSLPTFCSNINLNDIPNLGLPFSCHRCLPVCSSPEQIFDTRRQATFSDIDYIAVDPLAATTTATPDKVVP